MSNDSSAADMAANNLIGSTRGINISTWITRGALNWGRRARSAGGAVPEGAESPNGGADFKTLVRKPKTPVRLIDTEVRSFPDSMDGKCVVFEEKSLSYLKGWKNYWSSRIFLR